MNDDDLKKLFSHTEHEQPSGEAKARAHQAAMAAFTAAQAEAVNKKTADHQGNVSPLRPTEDNKTSVRRKIMSVINQRWVVSGVASAAVLVVTVSVLMKVSNPVVELQDVPQKRLAENVRRSLEERVVLGKEKNEAFADRSMPAALEAEVDSDVASLSPAPQQPVAESRAFVSAERRQMMAKASGASQMVAGASAPASSSVADTVPPAGYQDVGRDDFEHLSPNPVKKVSEEPVSTFSIDVDTASYSFMRRQLNQGVLPQKDAVRVEEMLNYFDYDYPQPRSREVPFATTVSVTDSPWREGNKLVHIGIRGYDMSREQVPDSNLVFLLDVSGSMNSPDKLPLVKQSMGLLLSQLKPSDTVAIVAYAGAAGTVLEPTPVREKQKILTALERLSAGGSTAGGQGIKLAYSLAKSHYSERAVNRVILATDGDFNVGITDREKLKGFVERERESGIFLSVLGFGQGNYHDYLMQTLAQNGNGVAAYIDTLGEAQKVLVDQATSTLFPIATDVKIQVEFNPHTVSEYRLLGYESRMLNREDFNNDRVDAGDIGAGHRVTAIYEITPVEADSSLIDPLRYGGDEDTRTGGQNEYGFLKMRYKLPGESKSRLLSTPISLEDGVQSSDVDAAVLARETGFATAVAGFAQLLKGGQYTGNWDYDDVIAMANANRGEDLFGYRAEFVQLVRKASVAQTLK